jgi:hypothetical protein
MGDAAERLDLFEQPGEGRFFSSQLVCREQRHRKAARFRFSEGQPVDDRAGAWSRVQEPALDLDGPWLQLDRHAQEASGGKLPRELHGHTAVAHGPDRPEQDQILHPGDPADRRQGDGEPTKTTRRASADVLP